MGEIQKVRLQGDERIFIADKALVCLDTGDGAAGEEEMCNSFTRVMIVKPASQDPIERERQIGELREALLKELGKLK